MNENIQNAINATLSRLNPANQTPEQIEANKRRVALDKAHQLNERTRELRNTWNAPKRHCIAKELEWGGDWGEVAKALAMKLEGEGGLLVALVGRRGAGKTQIAMELMRLNTLRQKSALYVSTTEWFMAVKSTYRKGADQTEIDIIKQYRKPNLLVLDEYGRRSDTEWENNLLFELLDKRYSDMNSTIIISNQKHQELMESLGSSLASRLAETGGVVECEWQSWRTIK